MIYLIHIDPPLGRSAHYLGWCEEHRLRDRLIEHARGRGATLTRTAVRTGSKLYLARTFPDGTPQLERTMKTHGQFKRMCPLCCEVLAGLKSTVYQIDAGRPEQPPPRAVLDWRPARPEQSTPSMRKGRPRR